MTTDADRPKSLSCQFAPRWSKILQVSLGVLLTSLPALAQTDAETAALKAKDAEIAELKAEVAQLKAAQAATPAPAPMAPADSSAPAPTPAQVATTAPAPAATGTDVTQMSAFEVRTTAGKGYSAGNNASAMKTSEPLMNIPAQIVVLTSDMIKDIGSHNATDVLIYAGVGAYYRGPAIISRGSRIGNPYIDDVPQATGIGVSDNTNIDTYQVIKGPEQVMYPLASLAGIVLETTKKPLPNLTQDILDYKIQEWGRQTFTFDTNHPLISGDNGTLTFRMEGILQAGDGPFHNSKDDRYGIFPSLEWDWNQTHLLVEYDAEIFHYLPGGTGILTPTGDIYNGLGARYQNTPPHDEDKNEQHDVRMEWTQFFSENWQAKTQATYFNVGRYGTAGFPSTVNWNNNTVTYTIRKDNGWNAALNVQSDLSGKYKIFNYMPTTTALGFDLQDQVAYSEFWTAPTVTIPIGSIDAINSVTFPQINSYVQPANPGSRTETYVATSYLTQTFDVIPKWVSLIAGFTFAKIETVADTNISVSSPYTATDLNGHDFLHRIAAVGHVTKDVTVYASESTTFSASAGLTYLNTPLPPVLGKSDEVGVKTNFLDGKVSFSAAAYKMTLTNQAVLAAYPALNIAGINYYIPIGSTVSHGWDASMTLAPYPGLQVVGTAYIGTVRDQNNASITGTLENSWSLFTRYDFDHNDYASFLHAFGIGGGATKSGGKWFTMSGLVLPGGAPLPVNASGASIFKLHQDVLLNGFVDYKYNKHLTLRVECENILDKHFPVGAQGVGLVDSVDPRTFSFEGTYKF